MKQYIGTKLIEAKPAYMVNGTVVLADNFDTPFPVPHDAEVKEGYKVRYPDGYESWSPRDVFERAYLPLIPNPNLKTDQPSISEEMVDSFSQNWRTDTVGDKTTVVQAVLRNGFVLVEASSCVNPENYDERIGQEICMNKIKDKVWLLLGFLRQTAVNGVRGVANKKSETVQS